MTYLRPLIRKTVKRLITATSRLPRKIPRVHLSEFTYNNKLPVIYDFVDDRYPSFFPKIFRKKKVDEMMNKINSGALGHYLETDSFLRQAMTKFSKEIDGKEGVDMGAQSPWYSAFSLAHRAKKMFIIEYNKIISRDSRITPFLKKNFDKSPRKFDFATSISSFEHDGLGRYGDPINPNGDILAMNEMKKIVKKDGLLFLSVPVGRDALVWNLHRIYGELRLPNLIKGWELVGSFGFDKKMFKKTYFDTEILIQPVFVLKNK